MKWTYKFQFVEQITRAHSYTPFGVVHYARNLALPLGELSAQPTERENMTIPKDNSQLENARRFRIFDSAWIGGSAIFQPRRRQEFSRRVYTN